MAEENVPAETPITPKSYYIFLKRSSIFQEQIKTRRRHSTAHASRRTRSCSRRTAASDANREPRDRCARARHSRLARIHACLPRLRRVSGGRRGSRALHSWPSSPGTCAARHLSKAIGTEVPPVRWPRCWRRHGGRARRGRPLRGATTLRRSEHAGPGIECVRNRIRHSTSADSIAGSSADGSTTSCSVSNIAWSRSRASVHPLLPRPTPLPTIVPAASIWCRIDVPCGVTVLRCRAE